MFYFVPTENTAEIVRAAELMLALERSEIGCHAAVMALEPIAKACWEIVEGNDERTKLLEAGVALAYDPTVRVQVSDAYWALEYSKLFLSISRAGDFMVDLEVELADDHERYGGGSVQFKYRTPIVNLEIDDIPSFQQFLVAAQLFGGVFDWEAKPEPIGETIAAAGGPPEIC